tara:strand:- start:9175 stop:9957 length:783 start_codon:yes stop_codon:yes gene_type:complete
MDPTTEYQMKFTAEEFNELSRLDLTTMQWPDWLCIRDFILHPGQSQRFYSSRWHRNWRFVRQVVVFSKEAEGTVRGHYGDTSAQLPPVLSAEGGHYGDSKGTVTPICEVEPVKADPDTLYTKILTPKGVSNISNDTLTFDFDQQLQDETRKSLLANGVSMRWGKATKRRLKELLEEHGQEDVKLVLTWWSSSSEERPRQLRGQDPWPDGQLKVRTIETIANNFERYLELATTTSVPATAEGSNQPTNPFMRVARNYNDSR